MESKYADPVRALLTAFLVAGACKTPEPSPARAGPDCQVLMDAATRASVCDPALRPLAEELLRTPDERRCRVAVRNLLDPRQDAPSVRSLHEPPAAGATGPLSAREREQLASLPLPATVTLIPDLPPGPGVPPTQAILDGDALEPDNRGHLRTTLPPGAHTLVTRHAGSETVQCITIDACETLTLTVHAARPASHPRTTAGPCPQETDDRAPPAQDASRHR